MFLLAAFCNAHISKTYHKSLAIILGFFRLSGAGGKERVNIFLLKYLKETRAFCSFLKLSKIVLVFGGKQKPF